MAYLALRHSGDKAEKARHFRVLEGGTIAILAMIALLVIGLSVENRPKATVEPPLAILVPAD